MTECLKCGYKWNATKKTESCPGCHATNWNETSTCNRGGGICDLCGTEFMVFGIGKDHRCPNCGSKRWYHTSTDNRRRLEDLHPWIMEKIKGNKTYTYWMASWREDNKVRNVHLGSCKKLSQSQALEKARTMKAKALGIES